MRGRRVRWASPERAGLLRGGPQELRGLKLGVEEQGGVGPAVEEEGGVGPGVQERGGGGGHEPSPGGVWGPRDSVDWRRPPPWPGSASWPVVQEEEGLGPRKQHQEKGGGSPAVQERGEASAGVQERGEGSPRGLLQRSEFGDGSWDHPEGLASSEEHAELSWESCGHLRREAVVLGAPPARPEGLDPVGRARPVGPQGLAGEGRLGVQEANWLPGVQEGQVVWAVQETYLDGKGFQEGEGPAEGHRVRRRRRRRRRW